MTKGSIKRHSVDELNTLSAGQAALQMMRLLHTSDLIFMYMLFKPESVKDLNDHLFDLINEERATFTSEELTEAATLYANMKEYYDHA